MSIINQSNHQQTGPTRGAVVFNQQPLDVGNLLNSISDQKRQATKENAEIEDNIAKIGEYDANTWDIYQGEADVMLKELVDISTEKLKAGGGHWSYDDQREIAKKKRDIATYVGNANRAQQEYLAMQEYLKQKDINKTVDVAKTYENMHRRIYEHEVDADGNVTFKKDENGNNIRFKDPKNITMDNVRVWREAAPPEVKPLYWKSTPLIYKTISKGEKDDKGVTTNTVRQIPDKKASVDNLFKINPEENYAKANEVARKAGYADWDSYVEKDEKAAYEAAYEGGVANVNTSQTDKTTYTTPGNGFNFIFGGGDTKFNDPDYEGVGREMNSAIASVAKDEYGNPILDSKGKQTYNYTSSNIYATDYQNLHNVSVKFTRTGDSIDADTGKKIPFAGVFEGEIIDIARVPQVNKKFEKDIKQNLKDNNYSEYLRKKILSNISGENVQYSKEDYDKIKFYMGDEFDKYFTEKGMFVTDKGELFSSEDKAALDAYHEGLMKAKATKEQADKIIEDIILYNKGKSTNTTTTTGKVTATEEDDLNILNGN